MRHPSDQDLVLHALALEEEPNLRAHLASCESCARRVSSFVRALKAVDTHELPGLTHEEEEDVFATAWRSSRRTGIRPFTSLWRWILQPAALFTCGLMAGYLAFTGQQPVTPPVVNAPTEVVQVTEPVTTPEPPIGVTPIPTELVSKPATTPIPDGQSGEDFWHMAGLRNVKLTPTVRYEDGKLVNGARLEGETMNGALVVMAF